MSLRGGNILSDSMETVKAEDLNDFSSGSVARNIMRLALPMTMAQLINVMYSVVDRIYIGHIPHASRRR